MRAHEIALLLPEVMRRTVTPGSPMAALLAVIEEMHSPVEDLLGGMPALFDPVRCPEQFLPVLARWVDLERLDLTPAGRIDSERMRLLLSLAATLGRRRGTWAGLTCLLTSATGVVGFTLAEAGAYKLTLTVPPGAASQLPLIRELVAQEKPAHAVVDVVLGPASPPAPVVPAAIPGGHQ